MSEIVVSTEEILGIIIVSGVFIFIVHHILKINCGKKDE